MESVSGVLQVAFRFPGQGKAEAGACVTGLSTLRDRGGDRKDAGTGGRDAQWLHPGAVLRCQTGEGFAH